SALIGSFNEDIKKQKIPAYVIIIIGIVLFVLGFFFSSQDLILDGGSIFISVLIFLAITFHKDWGPYRKISAIITILAVINPLVFVQITKILCGRIRFVDLAPGFTDYTPWFLPPGLISDGRSFPSGHTAMGFMFIPLLILVKDYRWTNPIKLSISILTAGWAVFVGLSRIVIGANYASDVLFSSGMAIVITILLYWKFYGKKK
ncbi:MAG: phosphatase PAP2 family protein, partial [Promethearchaeota archaeon]